MMIYYAQNNGIYLGRILLSVENAKRFYFIGFFSQWNKVTVPETDCILWLSAITVIVNLR